MLQVSFFYYFHSVYGTSFSHIPSGCTCGDIIFVSFNLRMSWFFLHWRGFYFLSGDRIWVDSLSFQPFHRVPFPSGLQVSDEKFAVIRMVFPLRCHFFLIAFKTFFSFVFRAQKSGSDEFWLAFLSLCPVWDSLVSQICRCLGFLPNWSFHPLFKYCLSPASYQDSDDMNVIFFFVSPAGSWGSVHFFQPVFSL